MERTINEKKAWRDIFIFTLIGIICFIGLLVIFAFRIKDVMLLVILFTFFNLLSIIKLCYAFYSLGWEYKRISLLETNGNR